MIRRFNQYPLIIDPSGQATEFTINEYRDRKITKTSVLDDDVWKNLELALRFGHPLRVFKAEQPDIDQKRSNLLKLHGEFQLRLRHPEKNRLTCLNQARGKVLNDDIRRLKTKNKKAFLERMRREAQKNNLENL